MTMGDRIVILNGGKIQQVDTPLHVYQNPANMFVAGFVGQMNFLTGVLGKSSLRLGDGTVLPLPNSLKSKTSEREGLGAVMGLRPEQLLPGDTSEAGHEITVTPSRVEMLGSEQLVHFSFGGHSLVARWPSDVAVSEGQSLSVKIEIDKALLFDGASEERII
jgi:ABC-type sugar transport system ATPase subunit